VPRFARVTDRQLRAWVLKGLPAQRIASLIGCSTAEVARRVSELWHQAQERGNQTPPTKSEIRQRCLEVQATWSPDEEERRRVGHCRGRCEATVVPESHLRRLAAGGR
jgi:hypothetical protein